jgi:hypothetical protein
MTKENKWGRITWRTKLKWRIKRCGRRIRKKLTLENFFFCGSIAFTVLSFGFLIQLIFFRNESTLDSLGIAVGLFTTFSVGWVIERRNKIDTRSRNERIRDFYFKKYASPLNELVTTIFHEWNFGQGETIEEKINNHKEKTKKMLLYQCGKDVCKDTHCGWKEGTELIFENFAYNLDLMFAGILIAKNDSKYMNNSSIVHGVSNDWLRNFKKLGEEMKKFREDIQEQNAFNNNLFDNKDEEVVFKLCLTFLEYKITATPQEFEENLGYLTRGLPEAILYYACRSKPIIGFSSFCFFNNYDKSKIPNEIKRDYTTKDVFDAVYKFFDSIS